MLYFTTFGIKINTFNYQGMKIGEKIRKVRELKNLSQENIATELEMSLAGYGRIERNEVDINLEKLHKIASIFKIKPEELLTFDDTFVFNISGTNSYAGYNNNPVYNHSFPIEIKQLYEDKITLLEKLLQSKDNEILLMKKLN